MATKLRQTALALVTSGVLLLGASPAVTAANSQVPFPVPFAVYFSGSAGFTNPTTTVFAGSGIAIPLGSVKTAGHADITGPDSSCTGGIANLHTETFTAANGDSITVKSQDVACPTGPNQYHGTGHWTVSGGTGRFRSATGKGLFDGHSDFGAGTFAAILLGTIQY